VILFESLPGRLPFGSADQPGLILRERDDPPDFPADLPPEARRAIERALRLDPAQRQASVTELLADLGQTARQGDSIRIGWSPAYAAARPAPARATSAAGVAQVRDAARAADAQPSDLRVAASELARGAMGVARGVWDGVRERGGPGNGGAKGAPSAAQMSERLGEGVLAIHSLSESEPGPALDSYASVGPEGRGGPGGPGPRLAAAVVAVAPGLLEASGAPLLVREERGATIPVPPRALGGALGAVHQGVVLGTEILGALVTGPVLTLLRATGRVVDRSVRGARGLLGSTLRWVVFFLVLAVLGGLIMALFLGALTMRT
jgi:hypothetical protein